MAYFLIGSNYINNSLDLTWRKIQEAAGLNSVNGKAKCIDLEKEKFRMGNLDSLMFASTQIAKLDTLIESQLKKIERQVQDFELNKKISFKIETRDSAGMEVDSYLRSFKWDESKFPRNVTISETIKEISKKVYMIEADLRNKTQQYQDKKNLLSQLSKKETGNLNTRDLTEVLKAPLCDKKDFVYSEYLTTLIAVVPKNNIEFWLKNYESFADFVVPGTTKQFGTEDKDGLTLWRVILFKMVQDEFIQNAKQEKITVREFKFDPKALEEKEAQKALLEAQCKQLQTVLLETCDKDYSELYTAYAHLKVLKLLSDCVMRYGINDKVITVLIEPIAGKERKIHQGLTKLFADPRNMDLYGTKEEIDDAEDFYPYAFVKFNV